MIKNMANRNNKNARYGVRWSEDEINDLLRDAKNIPLEKLAEKHQRSIESIRKQLLKNCYRQIELIQSSDFDKNQFIMDYSRIYKLPYDEIVQFEHEPKRNRGGRRRKQQNQQTVQELGQDPAPRRQDTSKQNVNKRNNQNTEPVNDIRQNHTGRRRNTNNQNLQQDDYMSVALEIRDLLRILVDKY